MKEWLYKKSERDNLKKKRVRESSIEWRSIYLYSMLCLTLPTQQSLVDGVINLSNISASCIPITQCVGFSGGCGLFFNKILVCCSYTIKLFFYIDFTLSIVLILYPLSSLIVPVFIIVGYDDIIFLLIYNALGKIGVHIIYFRE